MITDTRLVLVIDDDEVDRRRIIRYLGHQFAVCEASTARVGIEMARRLRPGCILLDYRLTDANGLEVLDQLVKGDFAVVLLTGQGDEEVAVRALKTGAVDYLLKDGTTSEQIGDAVQRSIARTLERRRHETEDKPLEGFEELVASVLRPNLTAVERACAEALGRRPELEGVLGDALRKIEVLDQNLRGLSAFATVQSLCAVRESVDLAEVGQRIESRLQDTPDLPSSMIELGDLPIVHGSPQALETLIFDLVLCGIHNAADLAGGELPSVRVSSDLTAGRWQIHIEDNGAPPSDDELSRRAFVPYRRGTGRELTLSVAARIVTLHGGEIWIEGRDSSGCRVTFSLPFKR